VGWGKVVSEGMMSIEKGKQIIGASAAWTAVQLGGMWRGTGIQSMGKGVIAEELEKRRELNTGAQIEEKADNLNVLLTVHRNISV
jgi:hypothetical protein